MATPRYPPDIRGGGEISCKLLVDQLKNNGYKVEVFHGINSYKIYSVLESAHKNFDIIHTYNMDYLPIVGKLSKKYNAKSVATLNGMRYSPSLSIYYYKYISPRFYRNIYLFRRYTKYIKKFATLYRYYMEKWMEDGIPKSKIRVIPNMIDPSFKPIKKRNRDASTTRLLYVGNYSKSRQEEIRRLIQIYSMLNKQDVLLDIVGKGEQHIKEIERRYKCKNPINYLGEKKYDEMKDVYSNHDIFIQPSEVPRINERVIYEALLSQLCIITTGNNEYSPVIKDMKHGVLVDSDDYYVKFYEKLQMLIDNPSQCILLAKRGKKEILKKCNANSIVNQYISLYEDFNAVK